MRVLRRHDDADGASEAEAEAAADERPGDTVDPVDETTDKPTPPGERRTFLPGWRRTADTHPGTAADTVEPPAPVVAPAIAAARTDDTVEADRDRTEPITTEKPVTTESEVRVELWSWADAVVSVIGAGLALVGLIALARAGIDRTWYRPVVQVLDADHTAALGAAEVGAGALLMLAGVARSRAAAALLGLALAIMGALAAIETVEVRRELAVEAWWAWMLAGVGLLVAVVALVPPRRSRVERVLETR